VFDVNVVGSARVARAFIPLLRRAASPRLAFTTSSSVLDPASRRALDAILAGQRYLITHGDLVEAVDLRHAGLRGAARSARDAS
jgi:NAD(P)-dependent dehydrogenase (short-subunit alcohol dehydrogenase family)